MLFCSSQTSGRAWIFSDNASTLLRCASKQNSVLNFKTRQLIDFREVYKSRGVMDLQSSLTSCWARGSPHRTSSFAGALVSDRHGAHRRRPFKSILFEQSCSRVQTLQTQTLCVMLFCLSSVGKVLCADIQVKSTTCRHI